jgi:tRNA1Val (adenine37-N6)-methyltransferase
MANHYFKFKSFTVYQEHCAMKVCTDACLQGAFTAQYLEDSHLVPAYILDIGAGTGLLSLMLAQKVPSFITAVELDSPAYTQAQQNFVASPWADRLKITSADIREWESGQYFDFIITNPPFYEAALKSNSHQRNKAMHATTLNYRELLLAIQQHLTPSGQFSILLPYASFDQFMLLAQESGYHLKQVLYIKQTPHHDFFRTIGIFSSEISQTITTAMSIYDEEKEYTPTFVSLLKDYYLYL